ncbi:hypothetical protein MKS88_004605 [Plasmodium brasilianum]|uniref:Uncharacterized protein n=1 Tax=Plasmodium brasilianum TaxID=5824 RepID=A0ACB9Y6J7_PLABR|nr:hypothetical protein MKS88_004605 [Plasmodium brasilianum]
MFHVPQNLIVHYHHCSIKDVGDVFIDCLNVQLFFLKNVLNCPFLHLVEEIHPFSNYGSYPYAFNTLEGNILYDTEIIDYLKNIYLFGSIEYELYFGILNELKTILIYYLWADDKIYNNFTKKIYKDRKLREENLEKCKMRGLDNHSFNIKRLKTILNILDNILYDKNKSRSEINMELQNVLLSKPTLIEFVKSLNDTHKVWKNEKSFLLGICNTC